MSTFMNCFGTDCDYSGILWEIQVKFKLRSKSAAMRFAVDLTHHLMPVVTEQSTIEIAGPDGLIPIDVSLEGVKRGS